MLCELIRAHRPDIVLLFETLVHKRKLEEIRVRVQFDGCFSVDSIGHSGGIGILWRTGAQVSLVNYAQNNVNMDVTDPVHGRFRLTAFYGFPERQRRKAL